MIKLKPAGNDVITNIRYTYVTVTNLFQNDCTLNLFKTLK